MDRDYRQIIIIKARQVQILKKQNEWLQWIKSQISVLRQLWIVEIEGIPKMTRTNLKQKEEN